MSRLTDEQRKVDLWNAVSAPIDQKVTYQRDDGSVVKTKTRSRAQLLSNHTAVIWLEHVSGCVALDRVVRR